MQELSLKQAFNLDMEYWEDVAINGDSEKPSGFCRRAEFLEDKFEKIFNKKHEVKEAKQFSRHIKISFNFTKSLHKLDGWPQCCFCELAQRANKFCHNFKFPFFDYMKNKNQYISSSDMYHVIDSYERPREKWLYEFPKKMRCEFATKMIDEIIKLFPEFQIS